MRISPSESISLSARRLIDSTARPPFTLLAARGGARWGSYIHRPALRSGSEGGVDRKRRGGVYSSLEENNEGRAAK